ncbi:hypothetical protein [Promicromonospora aerolata]|uniref:Uncharacterized protein n=1 Tax=Promicromonospora aerolata TaxID=195749 RepID=A0ABW4V4B3_9MICO
MLAATPGRLLVIGSSPDNRRVVRRDTSADGLLEAACATAGRDLTVQEWHQAADTAPPSDLSCTRAP